MDPLRKYESDDESFDLTYSYGEVLGTTSAVAEAPSRRVHDDDLSSEIIARLQADADEDLCGESWTLIDGYGG